MLRVYAIGDIHGLLGALCRLVAECERDADGRLMRFVFIGDYIDRGPDSRGVVDYIMNLQSRLAANAICIMGNHEALALSAIDDLNTENWILNGGDMTLRSYHASSTRELPAAPASLTGTCGITNEITALSRIRDAFRWSGCTRK